MSVISHKWKKTKKSYLEWLSKTELRIFFSKNLFYENLSLWWLTKVYEKDALNDHIWFNELNRILNEGNSSTDYKKINIFYEIFKTFLKLLKTLLILIFIKILFKEKKTTILNNKHCVHVQFSNLVKYKNNFIDTQYGLFSMKNKKVSYAIQLQYDFSLIYNYLNIQKKLKAIPVDYYIVNKHINISDIIKVYFFTFKKFFILNKALQKKNYFIINKKNCSKILKPLLLRSFFGSIQYSLLNGISFSNLFRDIKFKNFISYLEFFPTSRSVYFFIKNECNTNIVSINHANYSDNMLAYAIRKSEFSNKQDYLNFSPSPDIFFTQGDKYYQKLKKIFPHKRIFKIGSLKLGIQDIHSKKTSGEIKKKINTKKKILSLCLSTHDYLGMVEILNDYNLSEYFIVLRTHPFYKKATLKFFKNYFQHSYYLLEELSSREVIKASDFIISGDSSLCYEAIILGKKNIFRLYNEKYHPLYDFDDGVTIVRDNESLKRYLNKKDVIKNTSRKEIIKKFFYKYDKNAHLRLKKILKNL